MLSMILGQLLGFVLALIGIYFWIKWDNRKSLREEEKENKNEHSLRSELEANGFKYKQH